MPNTCRCKKCGLEAPVGPTCPRCGGKLNPKDAHVSWRMERNPVCDWMCWNAVMRVLLPALMLALALVLLLEAIMGGLAGVEDLLRKGLLLTFELVLLAASALTLLRMLLMGEDVLECVLDSKGLTVRVILPHPTAVKLLCRMRSPALLQREAPWELVVDETTVPWKDIRRVQLWPERTMVLLYAPRWWLRAYVPCDPFTYGEAMAVIRERLGKNKHVLLPPGLRVTVKAVPKEKAPKATQHPEPFAPPRDDE